MQELEDDEFVVGQSNTQEEGVESPRTVMDVILVIDLILNGQYNANYDLNGDGALLITDVIILVDSIINI